MPRSVKERYDELFGKTPDYDPIKIQDDYEGRGRRRALNIQANAPEINAGGTTGTIPYRKYKAIEPDQGMAANLVDLTKTGTAMLGEAVLGVGEYVSRQLARNEIEGVRDTFQAAASGLESVRGKLAAYRQSIYDLMPDDAIALKGAEFLTLDPHKTIWKGGAGDVGEAILYKFWESLPMMFATIIPGAVMMRAGASARAIQYLGASEGGLSIGFIANDITDGIQEMDDETLAKESPRFAALLEAMDSPEAARDQFISEAQGMAPLIGGVLVGAVSATAGRFIAPVITGKTATGAATNFGVGQRAARGAVSEGIFQEGPQESIEQFVTNIAQAVYDGDRSAIEGVAEAFVQGAVVGTPGGAIVGAIGGTSGVAAEPEPEDETPADRDRPDAPSSFRDVFGNQVPPPGGYTGAQPEQGDLFGEDTNLDPLDGYEGARELQEGARRLRADRIGAEPLGRGKKGKKKREQARAGRRSAMMSEELVDPALSAAVSATIREDNVMDDLLEVYSTQTSEATGEAGNLGGRLQGNLDLRGGKVNPPMVPSDSREIEDFVPGDEPFEDVMGANEPLIPQVPEPAVETSLPTGNQGDLFGGSPRGVAPTGATVALSATPPAQPTQGERGTAAVEGWVVRMTDDKGTVVEEDIFETAEEASAVADQWHKQIPDANINVTRSMGRRNQQAEIQPTPTPIPNQMPDQPTAEPLVDIQAQLDDLANEESDREAVYLSADNLARLQRDGLMEKLRTAGVALENFDDKGGMLIARDEEIAQGALDMKDMGMSMQAILGELTRAGTGKPMGDTVVQVRNEDGAVVRETLVASEDEAFALAEEIGDSAIVLTTRQALKRREKLIAEEQAGIEDEREATRQQDIIRAELPLEDRPVAQKRTAGKPATRSAAIMLSVAAKRAKAEKERAIGGFFPPDTLEFDNAQAEQDYRAAFSRLLDNQIEQEMAGTYPINRGRQLKKDAEGLFKQIGKIRQVTKPRRKVTRTLKVAAKIDKATARDAQRNLRRQKTEVDVRDKDYFVGRELTRRTREEIDDLAPQRESSPELRDAFTEAAYWLAGQFRNVEIVPEFFGVEVQEGLRQGLERDMELSVTDKEIAGSDDVLTVGAEKEVDSLLERMLFMHEQELKERRKKGEKIQSLKASKPTREAIEADESVDALMDVLEIKTLSDLQLAMKHADPLKFIAARFVLPGQQKKLIRRVNNYLARREYGGKVATRGVAAASTEKLETKAQDKKGGVHKGSVKSEYDTGVLTQQTYPQDEGKTAREDRLARSDEVRTELTKAVDRANKIIGRLENPKSAYGREVRKEDVDGNPQDTAQNLIVARAYYIALNQFALALIESGQTTTKSSDVMERLAGDLNSLAALQPVDFIKRVSTLSRADEQASLKTIAYPQLRQKVTDPKKRMEGIESYFKELMQTVARRLRLHKKWKRSSLYTGGVAQLMNKFTGAIAAGSGWDYDSARTWSEYTPTEAELVYLQHAMRNWISHKDRKKNFYTPLKRFFSGVGVTFDGKGDVIIPRSVGGKRYMTPKEIGVGYGTVEVIPEERETEAGKYEWKPSDEALESALSSTQRGVKEAATRATKEREIAAHLLNEPDPITGITEKQRLDEITALGKDETVDDEQAAVLAGANKAINAFHRIVTNKKSTIDKLVKAEQRLIKRMKDLGVWKDTKSPIIGQILVGVMKQYHRVGLRLLQKKISKQQAREMMARLKPFDVPKGLEQKKLSIPQAERDLDLLHEMVGPERNAPELKATAAALGIKLGNRNIAPSMSAMLRTMLETLPENHVYRALAERLLALNINDVGVQFDWGGKLLKSTVMGRFRIRQETGRQIYINRILLRTQRDFGGDMSVNVIHTMLHEMVHAATHRAIGRNVGLRNTILNLRRLVKDNWVGDLPYGLKEVRDEDGNLRADEFVAEAFSNIEFQNQLKKIYLDGRTAWRRFLDMLRSIVGLPIDTPISVMEVVMSLESELFKGSNLLIKAEADVDMNIDSALRPAMSKILDSLGQGVGSMKTLWGRPRPPLIAMTMEQIRDTYVPFFGGTSGPLRRYMEAFQRRNAENTRLMEIAEKITRKWTALNEQHGETIGEAFSEIATDATMAGVAMDRITHTRNKHIKSPKLKAIQQEIYGRYKKMPQEYRDLYDELQGYYRDSLTREVDLLTHNALRGLLQDRMTVTEFERKYSMEKLKVFDTAEKFNEEFKQYLDKDMLATLNQMIHVRQQREGDYFPLKRYGDFVVYAEREVERKIFSDSKKAHAYAAERRLDDLTLEVSTLEQEDGSFRVKVVEKELRMAETKTKAEQNRLEMEAEFGEGVPTPVMLKSTHSQEAAISSNAQLNRIITSLKGNPAAQAAIKNFYLESLSNSSFRKHEMKRKNRAGVLTGVQLRNFTVYAKQSSYYSAQLQYGSKMASSLAEMDKYIHDKRDESDISSLRLGQVLKELQLRDSMTVDINEIAKFAKTSVEITQFMMLTSPSYWMINASQPWMVTLPWLNSKYGLGKSLSAMKNAQKLIAPDLFNAGIETKGGLSALWSKAKAEKAFNVLDDVLDGIKRRDPDNYVQYKEMLDELKQQGVIDLSWIAELRDISEGIDTGRWQKTLDASRVMAHLTEVNNRILTALATYELEKQKAIDSKVGAQEAHEMGIAQAKLAVSQTQFNYSSPNKPRLFQSGGPLGPAGPMVFQFMQWPQHMYALMIQNFSLMAGPDPVRRKEARKLLTGLFATHLAAGGILGAALQPVKWAFGLLAMVFGDEGEDTLKGAISGETFDRGTMKLLTDMFGSEIATVFAKGLPTIIGGDLSQRMSIGTVYYLNFRGDNAESAFGSLVLGLGGASVNLVANFGRGVEHFFDGNYLRAIESASPKILRDVVRVTRYWDEGLVNRAGDTVIPSEGLTAWDLALQAIGVQPVVVSKFYGGQSAIKDKEIFFRNRKSDILKAFRKAVGNPTQMAKVLREVARFNRNNPAIWISRSALVQSVVGKVEREARYKRYGANIDEKAAAVFAEEAYPYR